MKEIKFSINQDILKIVALVTMTIDHIAKYLLDGVSAEIGICIGRISFPIFALLLMKHLAEKHIYKKYIIRLSFFGVLAFGVVMFWSGFSDNCKIFPLNILFSFLNVVLFLRVIEWIKNEEGSLFIKKIFVGIVFLFFGVFSLFLDYDVFGFLLMVLLYHYFIKKKVWIFWVILLLSGLINISMPYWFVSLLTMAILLLNDFDKEHKRIIKHWWLFYVYYVLHLFVIFGISYFLQ